MPIQETIFEEGNVVEWKRQPLNTDQVDSLIDMIEIEGLVSPFKVINVRNYPEDDRGGRGHSQEVQIACLHNTVRVKSLPGFWLRKREASFLEDVKLGKILSGKTSE